MGKISLHRCITKTKSTFHVQIIRSKRSAWNLVKLLGATVLFILVSIVVIQKYIQSNNDPLAITQNFIYLEPLTSFWRQRHNLETKIDYHDYVYIEKEKKRFGLFPGENGQPVYPSEDEFKLNKELFDVNGYSGLVSDKIALNRSVADFRHDECRKIQYLKDLPTVSVVIPFYNDHLSTLLRTVYSIVNRSPPHLLKEVILVNDQSTKDFLYDTLETHIKTYFKSGLVKLIVLPKRSGLIWARLAGARAAVGDVLLFVDSHTEASTNFLPPLLEPIAKDYRTCVCPFIDVIDYNTFAYRPQGEGSRGIFDWKMSFHSLPLRLGDQKNKWDNYENPVMVGGLFAISAKFFWELGGYDAGLDIWGGEQYELSFKIWLCGGKLYDSPCSRIGHVFRGGMPFPNDRKGIDFIAINYKRVAEVWMDEYKEYFYKRDPERYAKTEIGDISYQLFIKKRQQCKPFKYFIDHVAPDMLERYPFVEKAEFASGAIQSLADKNFCIDLLNRPKGAAIGLFYCGNNKKRPQDNQHFTLRFYRDIATASLENCFDCYGTGEKREIKTESCHSSQGNQYFRYDLETKHIFHGPYRNKKCMESDILSQKVYVTRCDFNNNKNQQWEWGFVNLTNMKNWVNYGAKIVDEREIDSLMTILQ